jgi:hypothetical protein
MFPSGSAGSSKSLGQFPHKETLRGARAPGTIRGKARLNVRWSIREIYVSKNALIALAAVVLAIIIGSWFFKDQAAVDVQNTPTGRQEIPVPGGTKGVPAERQTP